MVVLKVYISLYRNLTKTHLISQQEKITQGQTRFTTITKGMLYRSYGSYASQKVSNNVWKDRNNKKHVQTFNMDCFSLIRKKLLLFQFKTKNPIRFKALCAPRKQNGAKTKPPIHTALIQ